MKSDLEIISEIVVKVTGMNIFKNTRKREYAYARSLYYRLAREFTNKSLAEIGFDRHHATVLYSLSQFGNYCRFEPKLYQQYLSIKKVLPDMVLKVPDESRVVANETLVISNLLNENRELRGEILLLKTNREPLRRRLLEAFDLLPIDRKKDIIFKTETTLKICQLS